MVKFLFVLMVLCLGSAELALSAVFRIIDDPNEAKQIRVDLIESAKEEILASYFILGDDLTSTTGLALLALKAKSGVRVSLMLDGIFAKISDERRAYLESCGVEIRYFHPFSIFHPLQSFRRMHDKMLIVDGKYLVTGGRNIENSYYHHDDHRNYVDRDVLTNGIPAGEARDYFYGLFASKHVKKPKPLKATRHDLAKVDLDFQNALWEAESNGAIALDSPKDWTEGEKDIPYVRFLHSEILPNGDIAYSLASHLLALASKTGKFIYIESPYFVPTHLAINVIREAIARGVKVRVLTNSVASTDGLLAVAGYINSRKIILNLGVELWEYIGPNSLHAKSAVFDGTVVVRSYNLDPRSADRNTEVALVAEDPGKAQELEALFAAHLQDSYRVGKDGRPEDLNVIQPKVGFKRAATVQCLRLLVKLLPPLRNQL